MSASTNTMRAEPSMRAGSTRPAPAITSCTVSTASCSALTKPIVPGSLAIAEPWRQLMTRWQLTSNSPLALQLAADARLSQTDYFDDQVWELALGSPGNPALALQTSYGGRIGLAR